MERSRLAIATMTLVRDQEEEDLLRESLEILAACDLPVYITDGGSPAHFLDFLKGFSNFHVSPATATGLVAQVSNSLHKAFDDGREFILYTEPDKKYFFRELDHFLQQVVPDQAIFLASRSEKGFNSYPAFQRSTETAINNCCGEVTGAALDFTYGPFIMQRSLVPFLELAKEDLGWGWRTYIFGIPKRLGLTVSEYRGEFLCPPEQREDTAAERVYRMKQLEQSVRGIVKSTVVEL